MTMEMYATLDKMKLNTSLLILAASILSRSWCGNSRHISTKFGGNRQITIKPHYQFWWESVQYKPLWYMSTDGQTAMMKPEDFFAVSTTVPKDAVHKKNYGSWIHAIWLHLFSYLQFLSGPWHTLTDLTMSTNAYCPIYVPCSVACYVAYSSEYSDTCYLLVCKLSHQSVQGVCCLQQYISRWRIVYVDSLSNA
jgi:hypothetical protein